MPVHRHAFILFPKLDSTNFATQVIRDLFPGIETFAAWLPACRLQGCRGSRRPLVLWKRGMKNNRAVDPEIAHGIEIKLDASEWMVSRRIAKRACRSPL